MERKDISDAFVRAVGDGIREFNQNSPPGIVRTLHGVPQPPTEREKNIATMRWYEAVRYGLYKAVEHENTL